MKHKSPTNFCPVGDLKHASHSTITHPKHNWNCIYFSHVQSMNTKNTEVLDTILYASEHVITSLKNLCCLKGVNRSILGYTENLSSACSGKEFLSSSYRLFQNSTLEQNTTQLCMIQDHEAMLWSSLCIHEWTFLSELHKVQDFRRCTETLARKFCKCKVKEHSRRLVQCTRRHKVYRSAGPTYPQTTWSHLVAI